MADQSMVTTDKYIHVLVIFGKGVSSLLRFTVLPVECPSILGMPFLRQLNPLINWKNKSVVFGGTGGTVTATNNMFEGLQVDDVDISKQVQVPVSGGQHNASKQGPARGKDTLVDVTGDQVTLSVEQLIRMLPADVVEECVMCGGVEACVASFQHAVECKKQISRLSCPVC